MRPTRAGRCEKHPETAVRALAARQHGVVTRRQAIAAGMTRSKLETTLRQGTFVRVHPGVYAVAGAPRTIEQRATAAAAWGGPGAVVSHRIAGCLWHMVEDAPQNVDVSLPRKRTRPPPGIDPHFTRDLPPRDCGKLRNVPVTSPARTLIDLAGILPEPDVERALHHAIVDRRVTVRALRARLEGAPRRGLRGPAVLRRLLGAHPACRVVSPLERAVSDLLRCSTLPPFHREHAVFLDGSVYYLDFALPHFRVAVEADGRRWHSDPESFERDRVRHNALTAAGGGW